MMNKFTGIVFCLLLFLCVSTVDAQETAANINGRITDTEGEPLPGATIRAVHEPSGTEYGTTARSDGRYNLRNLRVGGPYTVRVTFVGFQEAQEEEITLELGQDYRLNFQMVDDDMELDELVIFGQRDAAISSDRTGTRSRIGRTELDRMPSISRSLQDYTRLTPQVSGNNIAGRSGRRNEIYIDGVTFSDRFGLGGDAIPTIGNPISLDAIDEFQVQIAPYDVRQGNFTGGSVNAVTRSGTNTFEGSIYGFGRNQNFLNANLGPDERPIDQFYEYQTGLRLGGPIIEDQLFFFTNLEIKQETAPVETRVFGDEGFAAGEDFDVSRDIMQDIRDITQNQYGYDPGGFDPIDQEEDDIKFFLKLDYNLAENHRLTYQQNNVRGFSDRGTSRSSNTFTFDNYQYRQWGNQSNYSLRLNSSFGDNVTTEAQIAYTRLRQEADWGDDPFPQVSIGVEGDAGQTRTVNLGVERFRHVNELNQDYVEFTGDLTYYTGDHVFTFGTNNYINFIENIFLQDFLGTYEFEDLEAFEEGRPSRYQYTYPTQLAIDEGMEQPAADWRYNFFSVYAQDEWSATDNLTLTLGARLDITAFPDEPLSNPTFADQFPYDTGEAPETSFQFNPRFGFNWNRDDTQIRGGVGLFSGGEPAVWLSNQYSNTGVDLNRLDARDLPAGFFESDTDNQPRPGDVDGLDPIETTEVNVTDPDFRINQVLRSNLAVEQRLPGDLIASFEGLFTRNLHDIDYQNLNLDTDNPIFLGATDDRPFYSTEDEEGNFSRNDVSADFTDILLLTNTNEGYQYSVTGQLRREAREGLFGSLSYTFSDGFSVNDGTSSRAISNWQFNTNKGNPNASELGRSIHTTRHRVLASASYRFEYGQRYATTISAVYDGRQGSAYDYVYTFGSNFIFPPTPNGDFTSSATQLVYIPESMDEVEFVGDNPEQQWADLQEFVANRDGLSHGEIADRGTGFEPFIHEIDLRISQQIGFFGGQFLELTLDILNVGNLFNNEWGQQYFVPFGEAEIMTFHGFTDDNRQRVSFEGFEDDMDLYNRSDISSRWRMQFGVRYTF